MKILISTPIYKKEGGPAKYAEILFNEFSVRGIKSKVVTYGKLIKFPTGIRHILYFFKIIPNLVFSNVVLSLDYYSAGWSSFVASKIFRKKHIIRVGGDFLWELYLERTKKEIYLSEFYSLIKKGEIVLNTKEKVIFNLSKFVLNNSDALVFPNEWLKQIFKTAYGLDKTKLFVIENEYENSPKRNIIPKDRVIFSPSRNIFLKNKAKLFEAMDILKDRFKDLEMFS
jgi:glycosyltransferase involved in cell wall biosynthesis